MPAGRPPLDLIAEVTLADGTRYRWDPGARVASDRPLGISFRTKKGEGFADAALTLPRRIDRDWVDLNLLDDFVLAGADGSTAYEGRVGSNPRSLGSAGHQMSVQLQGWMAHAKDRKFQEIWIDRDLSQWQQAARGWRAANIAGGWAQADGTVTADQTSGLPALELGFTTVTTAGKWAATAMYDAGAGLKVGGFYADIANGTNAPPVVAVFSSDNDNNTGNTTEVAATGAGYHAATAHRFLFAEARNDATVLTAALTYAAYLRSLAVYGTHGLTRQGAEPAGLYASDVIANIVARFCPRLSSAGVQATSYAIPHLVHRDPAFPYDAFLEANKFHLWSLGVWENKTLTYKPYDLSDYDWEIRLSDTGVELDLQGDSVDQFANGICVSFVDVATGRQGRITPASDSTLADSNPNNPANAHGLSLWTEIALSAPTTAAAAAQIGRAVLAEFNQPKGPGTIRVSSGYLRDRAGHWQPAWKVRADQRIAITDHPNDRPRLIVETDWNQDQKLLTVGVDSTLQRVDAVLDRITTALQAANLT